MSSSMSGEGVMRERKGREGTGREVMRERKRRDGNGRRESLIVYLLQSSLNTDIDLMAMALTIPLLRWRYPIPHILHLQRPAMR